MSKPREYTGRVMKHVAMGHLDAYDTLLEVLNWMDEREVRDFYKFNCWNELLDGEDPDEEEVDNLEDA